MKKSFPLLLIAFAVPAISEEIRNLDSHEHGVGELNIAIDGNTVAMEFHAPGADIVGFEYAAESAEDRASIDAAVASLAKPLDLFVMPAAAKCTVVQASAGLTSDEENHDHEDHHDDEHEHDHSKENHDEDDHADEAAHTEFHAEYTLACGDPNAVSKITFAYFDTFPNTRGLEVQIISDSGAQAFEVEREEPTLDLRGMF